jgi:hypothetical protein
MKIALVIPTIRENSIKRFLQEWDEEIKKHRLTCFIVEDNPTVTFDLGEKDFNLFHYSWEDFKKDLGKDEWIIPRRNSSIRSFGFLKAYKMGFDIIVTLDDDCYPINKYLSFYDYDYFDLIIKRLNSVTLELEEEKWEPTVLKIRSRGYPYKNESIKNKKIFNGLNVILNHGLWANIPDLDSINQILNFNMTIEEYFIDKLIPQGKYFTMCGMNLAFKKEAVPALYFLLMGEDERGNKYPYDRFDDIWAGIFFKKICDHLGYHIVSGHPIIWHDRASNYFKNLQKEATGIEMNEKLWKIVDEIKLTKNTFKECYRELAEKLPLNDDYFSKLKRAMIIWSDLF